MIIAIDGPTASGKSSVAKALAEQLNFYYLNTGMLYRAVTYLLVTYFDYTQITLSAVQSEHLMACTDKHNFQYGYNPVTGVSIAYQGSVITQYLKDANIDILVCIISPQPLVRDHLSALQRMIAQQHDVVVEGRDVGSVVFPHADRKFYLTASLEVRAQRWQKDQEKQGNVYSLEEAQERVHFRDSKDINRSHSPLVIAQDAIIIDNSWLSFEQTVETFMKLLLDNQSWPN